MTKILKSKLLILLALCAFTSACESEQEKVARLKIEAQKLDILRLAEGEYEKTLLTFKADKVKYGQGMFQALKNVSVTGKESLSVINSLRDKVQFTNLKVGDQLTSTFDKNSKLVEFIFSNNPAEKHILIKDNASGDWKYSFLQEATTWKSRIITGKLKSGSTLQNDLIAQGLKRSVVGEVVNILLCKINFRFDARMGDQYKILLKERIYKDQILATKVLFTSYKGHRTGSNEAYFYSDPEKKSTYTAHYTEEGEALIRSGLRYPVNRLHIRSGYGRRRHPVTGRSTMHRGVDLRARKGSPVYAVAIGVVVQSKYHPISGNKVAIRHSDNSTSYYLHLDRRMVNKGQRVKSHQIIGKVGATGRVTGPHLHFGFKKPNGRWMNPMHKRMIATPKLKGKRLALLKKQVEITKEILTATSI